MKKLVILIVVVLGAGYMWYTSALRAVDSVGATRIKLTVEPGSSTTTIASQLQDEGLIRSALAFKIRLKQLGLDGSLQAGVFLLDQSQNADDIIEILQTGRAEEMIVTIPEGFTIKDIDKKLADMGLIDAGELIDCANRCDFSSFEFLPTDTSELAERGGKIEGYVYPDTYYVPAQDFVAKFFLERMLGAFRKNILIPYEAAIADSDYTLHEIVTMASLVEEETLTDEERPIVADIIHKRYDDGWGLGIDAAVRYIVNKPTADITVGDLNVNSPYNLRKFKGMPPGPIANSSKKSFEAVLYPKETVYWYYLHDSSGQIHYSVTNEEHNTKRYKYLGGGSK